MSRRVGGLVWLAAAVLPGLAAAQAGPVGRVAARAEPAALILGRACLDLDADGRCGPAEPGVAGARLRLADGRRVTADADGRFHLSRLEGRTLAPTGAGYGAVVVKVDGLGEAARVELGPEGAALVDLPVAPPETGAPGLVLDRVPRRAPLRSDGALSWPIEGRAAPGTRVRVDGQDAEVDDEGRFAGAARLGPGRTTVVVSAVTPGGAAVIEAIELLLVEPEGGVARLYPGAVRRLAELSLRSGPGGVLVAGRAGPGAAPRLGGITPAQGEGGAFAAFLADDAAAPLATVDVELAVAGPRGLEAARAALPVPSEPFRLGGVALGELELSFGDGGTRLGGRGAGTVAGRWGGVRLAAGFDVDDRDRRLGDLVRPRDEQSAALVPERPRDLASPGDGSVAGDDDPGRGRLWARADAAGASLRLGWTRSGLDGDGLGRYDRALFGGRLSGEGEVGPARLRALAFGAASGHEVGGQAPARAVHEELTGTGGSLYYLAGRAVVAGSEVVRLARRDPVTGLASPARTLERGADYLLDEAAGRLWLTRPLAPAGPPRTLTTGDPLGGGDALLLVDYLDAGAGGAARLAGGLAGAEIGPLRLEARAADEAGPPGSPDGWRMASGRAALDLGAPALLSVEVARSEGRLHAADGGFLRSLDGGFSAVAAADPVPSGGATAIHLHGRGEAAGLGWSGWWRERQGGFSDGDRQEVRQARERGAEVGGDAGPLRLSLGYAERTGTDERDPSGATTLDRRRATGRVSGAVGGLGLTGELLHDRDAGVGGAQAAAGVAATWRAAPGLGLELSHLQAFAADARATALTFTGAGASLDWGDGRLALRGGWGPDLGPRLALAGERRDPAGAIYGTLGADPSAPARGGATGSVLGARGQAGPLELFTEEQVSEDRLGLRAGRVVGAAASPAPGLRLSIQAERGERLLPGGDARARSAAGAGIAYLRGALSASARAELLSEGGDRRVAASGSAAWAASREVSVALHALAAGGEAGGRRADDLDASLGLAWRAAGRAALLTLARVESARPDLARRAAWLLSAAATAEVGARLRAGLGARLAVQRIGGLDDDRVAGSLRLEARLVGPLDVAAEYARRAALGARVPGDLDAVRLEAGLSLGPSRLALGWTLVGFAGDGVDPASDTGRFFLRATLGL